jgi:hypothetical protein
VKVKNVNLKIYVDILKVVENSDFSILLFYEIACELTHTGRWLIKHKLNVISNYSLLPSPACDGAL